MRIIPDGPASLRDVIEALVRLPEPVRAFALEKVVIFVNGAISNGSSVEARALQGRDWLVNVTAQPGMQDVILHELAHAWLAHDGPSTDHEAEAAHLAAAWGARGDSADPEGAVARFWQWIAPTPQARVTDDAIALSCSVCGDECFVLSPTAAGLPARVGIECRCGVGAITLASVASCSCGATASVVWAEGATPTHPVAEWRCDACGARQTREIRSGQDPTCPMPTPAADPNLSYADALLIQAARALESHNGLGPDMVWARRQLRRALGELADDPRRQDVEATLAALKRLDAAGAARGLTALLGPALPERVG